MDYLLSRLYRSAMATEIDAYTHGAERPLNGIRVLDLGRIMAAPWATQVLADLGAEVIKIERPNTGDDTRSWGPPFVDIGGGVNRESGYFLSVNRGKKSVTIDITQPEGQRIVREIAARSDIVIENFKSGALARYGLDAASLRASSPALIYCSLTGFGQDGPRSDDAAYDFAIQALGGLMSVTGERDDLPGGGPQKVGVPIIDLMTGMYAAVAILGALAGRARTGRGDTIDLAMLDVATAMLANQAMNYLVSGRVPKRGGNRHPNIQPQDVFACSDGHIVLAVGNDAQFRRMCEVLGMSELPDDPAFATNAARVASSNRLVELLGDRFAKMTVAEVDAMLAQAQVPAAPINTIEQVVADPQVRHREMIRSIEGVGGVAVPQVASPIRYAEAPVPCVVPPPLLGQHTEEVLMELGIGPDECDRLRAEGVV